MKNILLLVFFLLLLLNKMSNADVHADVFVFQVYNEQIISHISLYQ